MTTVVSADGSLAIPEEIRRADDLKPGQPCDIERVGQGDYRVQVNGAKARPKESWVRILLECPVKDWWEPMDHSNLLITRDNTRLFEDTDE